MTCRLAFAFAVVLLAATPVLAQSPPGSLSSVVAGSSSTRWPSTTSAVSPSGPSVSLAWTRWRNEQTGSRRASRRSWAAWSPVRETKWWSGRSSLAGTLLGAGAQDRSVGVSVGPWLKLYDEGWACCMSVGAWLQLGRFQIEHEVGLNVWHVRAAARYDRPWHEPLVAEGWATTAHWDVKTWRTARTATRFRAALAHRRNSGSRGFAPDFYTLNEGWTFNVGLAVDLFPRGRRPFLRAGLRGIFPEPQLGVGFPF